MMSNIDDDQIENLVEQAHSIFGRTSIFEVMDLNRDEALKILVEFYGPVDMSQVEEYFSILDKLR